MAKLWLHLALQAERDVGIVRLAGVGPAHGTAARAVVERIGKLLGAAHQPVDAEIHCGRARRIGQERAQSRRGAYLGGLVHLIEIAACAEIAADADLRIGGGEVLRQIDRRLARSLAEIRIPMVSG